MNKVIGLRCRECGEIYPKRLIHACSLCFGPLDVAYDYDAIAGALSREAIGRGPPTIWRYRDLLPVEDGGSIVDIGAGLTPLLRADNLARELGLNEVYVKNDSVNPTFSFKDRPSSVAVSKAIEFGSPAVGAASTGNLAGAIAAHAARARLPCFIFIPEGLEVSKVVQTLAYGAHIIEVAGTYDQANRLATEIALTSNIAFANINVRPYYVEGSKTLVFEICEQLGWRAPEHIIVPVASGALLHASLRGLKELEEVGLIDDWSTRISAAQAAGCSPVVQAIQKGTTEIIPVEKPNTLCKSLAIGDPADGYYAIQAVRSTGGTGRAPSNEEILNGIKLLARTEGVFTEPAGGAVVAALKRLVEEGEVERDEQIVLYITGNGLKTQESLVPSLIKPFRIGPTIEDFRKLLINLQTPGVKWLEGV